VDNKGFNSLSLSDVNSIDVSDLCNNLKTISVIIVADVNIRLLGPNGQAHTFGPQKGATASEILYIENGLTNWSKVLTETFNKNFDIPFAGAAGGLGAGIHAFCDGKLEHGIEFILKEIDFKKMLDDADIVITGEGKLDDTSLHGKASIVISRIASASKKLVIGVFGTVDGDEEKYAVNFKNILNASRCSSGQNKITHDECRSSIMRTMNSARILIEEIRV
jgi:glycerate kinase